MPIGAASDVPRRAGRSRGYRRTLCALAVHRRKCCARSPRPIVAEAWIPRGIVGALPLVLDVGILRALRSDHAPSFDFSGTPAGLDAIGRDVAHAVVAIEDSSLLMTLAWHGLG